jgi:hypothetical protein
MLEAIVLALVLVPLESHGFAPLLKPVALVQHLQLGLQLV